jgi:hypothetical protein
MRSSYSGGEPALRGCRKLATGSDGIVPGWQPSEVNYVPLLLLQRHCSGFIEAGANVGYGRRRVCCLNCPSNVASAAILCPQLLSCQRQAATYIYRCRLAYKSRSILGLAGCCDTACSVLGSHITDNHADGHTWIFFYVQVTRRRAAQPIRSALVMAFRTS